MSVAPSDELATMYKERWQGEPRESDPLSIDLISVAHVDHSDVAETGCIMIDKDNNDVEICGELSFDSTDDGMVRRRVTSGAPRPSMHGS